MNAALVIIGRGDTPGIHINAFELDLPEIDDDAPQSAATLQSIVQQRAALSQKQIPVGRDHALFKVSRFEDSDGRVWTWVGRYVYASFAGENREGHYFGIGLAFAESLVSEAIAGVLDDLLSRLLADIKKDGVVVGSVHGWAPSNDDLRVIEALRFTKLPHTFSGLQPGRGKASQQFCDDWSNRSMGRLVVDRLIASDAMGVSTMFLTNWRSPQDGEEFYDVASTRDAASSKSASAVRRSAPSAAPQRALPDRARTMPVGEGNSTLIDLTRRVSHIERRLDDIERKSDKNVSNSERPTVLWILAFLVGLVLMMQILTALSSKILL